MFIHTIRELKLSADQINVLITYLEIRKTILSAMINFTCNTTGALDGSGQISEIGGNVTSLMEQRCQCINNGGTGTYCLNFLQGISSLNKGTDSTAFSAIAGKGLDALEGNPNAIQSEIDDINRKLDSLESELSGVGYDLPGFATAPLGPQPTPDDDWFQFDYNSKTEREKVEASSQQTSASLDVSYKSKSGFSFGGSGSYSKQTQDNFNSFSSDDVRVSGELLRVSVQMPWFRPELFNEKKLTLVRTICINNNNIIHYFLQIIILIFLLQNTACVIMDYDIVNIKVCHNELYCVDKIHLH